MKRIYIFILFVLFTIPLFLRAQTEKYPIVFYNLENLFDTLKSPGVYDQDFTPEGIKAWNGKKYLSKIANIEKVFYNIAGTLKTYPVIIGVSEIENRNVLEDIASAPKLQKANYQIAHFDSPDARGVDVALFYRPDKFKYEGCKPIPVVKPDNPHFKTRDILSVWGTIEGERFNFFVCHWPSRLGGEAASEPNRILAAETLRNEIDNVLAEHPDTKIVVMGDMNDDPTNKSLTTALNASGKISEVEDNGLFNPFFQMFKNGYGTLAYQDAWSLFDNILVSKNLIDGDKSKLKLYKNDKSKFYGNIFDASFLKQKSGQYKNYPLRTFVGNTFQNGYSDHFPVYLIISK